MLNKGHRGFNLGHETRPAPLGRLEINDLSVLPCLAVPCPVCNHHHFHSLTIPISALHYCARTVQFLLLLHDTTSSAASNKTARLPVVIASLPSHHPVLPYFLPSFPCPFLHYPSFPSIPFLCCFNPHVARRSFQPTSGHTLSLHSSGPQSPA